MEEKFILEIIGYVGSAFVLISFLMATVVKLRIINSIGSIVSVIYGILIHAYPTVVMNACLLIINCYQLIKMYRYKVSFNIVNVDLNDACVNFFINYNKDDIVSYFPNYENSLKNANFFRLIYCENKLVGFFAATQQSEDKSTLIIQLDYTIKEYRDYSVGHYLFQSLKLNNIDKVQFIEPDSKHIKYLEKMGFYQKENTFEKFI